MSDPKYFNANYEERPFQEAKNWYGVDYQRANVPAGQLVYRLLTVREKFGTHCLATTVLDQNGRPQKDIPVTFYWPDAPDLPEVYAHDWYPIALLGYTNLAGDVGPGMGGGAWIDVDPNPPHHAIMCGPHRVWIHLADIPSDICLCLGMRGGTNHDHLDPLFQLVIAGSAQDPVTNGEPEPPPPPEPPPDPEEPCGWRVEIDSRPGISLLIGKGLPAGTPVTVTAPWGHTYTVTAGSKQEYGAGGWELPIWHPAKYHLTCVVSPCRAPCEFDVAVENCTVTVTFIEGEPPTPQARVVTAWMDQAEAETLLQVLEQQHPGVFSLES